MIAICLLGFCLLAGTSMLASGTNDARVVDVKLLGAKGDGAADDTAVIRRAFDLAARKSHDNPDGLNIFQVFFPPGVYRVTDTLSLGPRHGAIKVAGQFSTLSWDGPSGGTLIDAEGCPELQIDTIKLEGNKKAGILLRINSLNGHPAAQYLIDNLHLSRAATGIEVGGSGFDGCGSDMTLTDLNMSELTTGFHTLRHQNVNFTFIRPQVGNCSIGMHFEKGGSVVALMYSGWKCDRFIKIGFAGINNGNFSFIGMKPEVYPGPTTGERGTILETGGGEIVVTFQSLCTGCIGCRFGPQPDDQPPLAPLFILGPGTQVSVENSLLSGNIATLKGAATDPTWMQFDNCRFRVNADPRKDIACGDFSGFEVRNSVVVPDGGQAEFISCHKKLPEKHVATGLESKAK